MSLRRHKDNSPAAIRGPQIDLAILIADLPRATLGLDMNAAGRGWYINDRPKSNVRFVQPGNQGDLSIAVAEWLADKLR